MVVSTQHVRPPLVMKSACAPFVHTISCGCRSFQGFNLWLHYIVRIQLLTKILPLLLLLLPAAIVGPRPGRSHQTCPSANSYPLLHLG